PPETPTATCGARSNGPSRAIRWAKSSGEKAAGTPALAGAAVALLGARGAILDRRGGLRELRVQLLERGAGVVLAAGLPQRHAELQQIVRGLLALRIFLIALGEGDRRVLVVALGIIGFAQPVLRVAGQRILRMLGDEGLEG